MRKKNIVKEKSFCFALEIIELYKKLIEEKEFVISKQLLRSGTSIGANIEEASAAYSRNDFLHKMTISSKEARETLYWLKLIQMSNLSKIDVEKYITSVDEIVRILTSIVKTTKSR